MRIIPMDPIVMIFEIVSRSLMLSKILGSDIVGGVGVGSVVSTGGPSVSVGSVIVVVVDVDIPTYTNTVSDCQFPMIS
jgi:hypothetical protein